MWLFEDNHLLTLNKPAGLLSQADSTGNPDVVTTAKQYIKQKYNKPGNVYIGLVHRLDLPTSGAMVLARTSKAARRLSEAFREHNVEKRYAAIVQGDLQGSGIMEDYLSKAADRAHVRLKKEGGKYARLHWQVVHSRKNYTWVTITLITGRAHQIRCQFSNRGFPILGDIRYGARASLFCGTQRIALHCRHLCFAHPVSKHPMHVGAPLPDFWDQYFEESEELRSLGE